MPDNTKVLLTGGAGFLGQHVHKKITHLYPEYEVYIPRKNSYDLRDKQQTIKLFDDVKPNYVIHLAATCGGIGANMKYPGQYFFDNISMGINTIEESRNKNVKKFILISTVCAYPKFCTTPFKEEDIWEGYPEETNAPYGIAKKTLSVMLEAYKKQYGLNSMTLVPSNLYGPGDNFDTNSSHVIPALILKIQEAKINNSDLIVWGDGSASREFLFVEDAAEAVALSINYGHYEGPINLGTGQEITIKNLVSLLCKLMNFHNNIIWDTSKPNGQPRRCLDTSRSESILGWFAKTNLEDGLRKTLNAI